jgi:hypothetical protein
MPKPEDYENKEEFIKVCIPKVIEDGTAKDNKQAVALCNLMWAKKEPEKKMKLETVNIKDIEIFETGYWKGQRYTEEDIDDFIQNFENKIAEPYITIDHNPKATKQFQDALQALSLGFVDSLKRVGKKLVANFKQVPKTIANLIEAGALKKRSIEFRKNIIVNGKLYKHVLEGVTFHGANGLPEVNSLSDYLRLYKSNLTVMNRNDEGIVSLKNSDKEEKMDEITLKQADYNELLKNKTEFDVVQSANEKLKAENKELSEKNEKLEKFQADYEKNLEKSLQSEAETYINDKIQHGFIKPAHKDRYVAEYIRYKKEDDNMFKSFCDDIESRNKIIGLSGSIVKNDAGAAEYEKYDPEKIDFKEGSAIDYEEAEKHVQAYMKLKNVSWAEAAKDLGYTDDDELGKGEV